MEFALVKDPGGEDAQCDDLGTASIELISEVLMRGAEYTKQTLAVIGQDEKKVADIVVSVTALNALTALQAAA